MTTDERLSKIDDKLDMVLEIIHGTVPMVKNHEATLYGNGKPGLKQELATHIEAEKYCPAKVAFTDERKRTNIAVVAVVISGVSLMCTLVLVIMGIYKGLNP